MAFAAQYTLADARAEVQTRLGFADQGTAVTRGVKRINSFIQQAVNELVFEADWTDMYQELSIPLIEGQDRYEFPDETQVGQIIAMQVQSEVGTRHPMQGGIQQQDWYPTPTDTTLRAAIGQPCRWRYVDREIQIIPAPTTTFTNLVITYIRRTPILRDDGDLLPFDSEAIIQRAVIHGKIHYQQPGLADSRQLHAIYLARVKTQQGPGRVFFVGGRKSFYITRDKRVPLGEPQHRGPWSSYSPDWQPW
jgi:hypothetical protein